MCHGVDRGSVGGGWAAFLFDGGLCVWYDNMLGGHGLGVVMVCSL